MYRYNHCYDEANVLEASPLLANLGRQMVEARDREELLKYLTAEPREASGNVRLSRALGEKSGRSLLSVSRVTQKGSWL